MAEFEKLRRKAERERITRAEAQLKIKKPGENETRALTGFEEKEGGERRRELMRLESSYGNISFGTGEKRRLTVTVSEKRRHDSPSIDREKKLLREASEFEKPLGRGKIAHHGAGSAVSFRFDPDSTKNEVVAGIKKHMNKGEPGAANRMMPFLNAQNAPLEKGERDKSRQLENNFTLRLRDALEQTKKEPEKPESLFGIDIKSVMRAALETAAVILTDGQELPVEDKKPDEKPDEKPETEVQPVSEDEKNAEK